jgi:hypothetical protein
LQSEAPGVIISSRRRHVTRRLTLLRLPSSSGTQLNCIINIQMALKAEAYWRALDCKTGDQVSTCR